MDKIYHKYSKYENLLNRIQKNISIKEGFFMIMKQYLTNNILYYFLCIITRFIPLIILTGNYHDAFAPNEDRIKEIEKNENYEHNEKYNHYLMNSVSASKWVREIN